jgi:hypothetical protein
MKRLSKNYLPLAGKLLTLQGWSEKAGQKRRAASNLPALKPQPKGRS